MDFKTKVKQFFCKHDYRAWANIYSPMCDQFSGARTVYMCKKCKNKYYSKDFEDAPFNYNMVLYFLDLFIHNNKDTKALETVMSKVVQDDQLYKDFYDIKD